VEKGVKEGQGLFWVGGWEEGQLKNRGVSNFGCRIVVSDGYDAFTQGVFD